MPEPTKIPRPFADSGDKNTIPESSGALGFASWQEGFPAITGTPFAQGGVAPKRADFNGVFNALSAAAVWNQQGGVYTYDATTDYEVGNIVEYSGDLYKCISANGPSSAVKDPTDATAWDKIATSAFVKAFWNDNTGSRVAQDIANKTIASGVNVNLASFTLTKGVWLVEYTANFRPNGTGSRALFLATTSTGNQLNNFNCARDQGISNAVTNCRVFTMLDCTANSATYYVNAYQDSGGNLTLSDISYAYMKVRAL